MVTEAQKKASAKYRKKNVKEIVISFYPGQHYMFDWLTRKADEQGITRVKLIREIIEQAYGKSK